MATMLPVPVRPARYFKGRAPFFLPFYHAVSDRPLPYLKHLYPVPDTAQFEKDLDYLLQHFRPVSWRELYGVQTGDKPPMHLSFDDGLEVCASVIAPILKRKGIPATFFLNNDFIDNKDLFYRYKVSLLLDRLPEVSASAMREARKLMNLEKDHSVEGALQGLGADCASYCKDLAVILGLSFEDHLAADPVYMSTELIRQLLADGFDIGSHSSAHFPFSGLERDEVLQRVGKSVDDLCERFQGASRIFAFPFTDDGVTDAAIEALFENKVVEAAFGTAGLKTDRWPAYFQRVPMEFTSASDPSQVLPASKVLGGEIHRARLRQLFGRNHVNRNAG